MKKMWKYGLLVFLVGMNIGTLLIAEESEKGNLEEPEGTPTVITCEGPLDVDFSANKAIFTDRVVIKDPKGDVYCDQMTVFFEQEQRQVYRVEAEGNVIIYIENKIAKSDRAVYEVEKGELVLTGNPRIHEDRNVYAADKITIFQKDGKTEMKLEPKARLLLYKEDSDEEGFLF